MRLFIVHRNGWIQEKGDIEVLGWNHLSCYKASTPNTPPGFTSLFPLLPTHEKQGKCISSVQQKQEGKLPGWETEGAALAGQSLAEGSLSPACFRPKTSLTKRNGEKRAGSDSNKQRLSNISLIAETEQMNLGSYSCQDKSLGVPQIRGKYFLLRDCLKRLFRKFPPTMSLHFSPCLNVKSFSPKDRPRKGEGC